MEPWLISLLIVIGVVVLFGAIALDSIDEIGERMSMTCAHGEDPDDCPDCRRA